MATISDLAILRQAPNHSWSHQHSKTSIPAGADQGDSFNGQTSTTPCATAHGTCETFSMASARSVASMRANPAIGKADDMNGPLRVFYATRLWIADLNRCASDPHHGAFGPQF
jgi:hypothetical protein